MALKAMQQNYPRIGVVLSSGGVRGVYAHTGFMLALERLGIPIAAAAGCSAGAVVGGIAANGTDLHAWSDALALVDRRRFWTPDPWPMLLWHLVVKKGRGYSGLSGTETAMDFFRRQLAVQTFEECRYPFHALAISLRQGRKVMFSTASLRRAWWRARLCRSCIGQWRLMATGTAMGRWWTSRQWMPSVVGMVWMYCSFTMSPHARQTSSACCIIAGQCLEYWSGCCSATGLGICPRND